MNKSQVMARYFEVVRELEEEPQDIILSAGGALVMMGVREEAEDLDLDVSKGTFNWAARGRKVTTATNLNPLINYAEDVDFHIRDEDAGVVKISGVWCYSPNSLLVQKRHLAALDRRPSAKRDQDLKDIARLEEVMKEQKFTASVLS